MAELQGAWQRAVEGRPVWVHLSGPAGVGKTRLGQELTQWVTGQGFSAISTRCFVSDRNPAFAPLTRLLSARPLPHLDQFRLGALARLLPEILTLHPSLPPVGPLTKGWQKLHLFDALARALFVVQPVVILICELQPSDPETIEFLEYLLNSGQKPRLLLLTTAEPKNKQDNVVESVLSDVRHQGQLIELELHSPPETEPANEDASESVSSGYPETHAS